jgi:hypothetical protein
VTGPAVEARTLTQDPNRARQDRTREILHPDPGQNQQATVLHHARGRPPPGYFDSLRGPRFARFVFQREFRELNDAFLVIEFEAHRRAEMRLLIFTLSTMSLLAVLIALVRYVT